MESFLQKIIQYKIHNLSHLTPDLIDLNLVFSERFNIKKTVWKQKLCLNSFKIKSHLLWSKNSIERLMISSSVIILLSSSATSPRSSCDPFEALGRNERTSDGCSETSHLRERERILTHHPRGAPRRNLSFSSFHLRTYIEFTFSSHKHSFSEVSKVNASQLTRLMCS